MSCWGLLLLIRGLKVFIMLNSLKSIVISGAQNLLMLIESKFLIKMIRLKNIKIKIQCFVACRSSYQSYQHQEALSTWNNNILEWSYHDKSLNLSKTRGLGCPFWFHIFFSKALCTPWVFWLRFRLFFKNCTKVNVTSWLIRNVS